MSRELTISQSFNVQFSNGISLRRLVSQVLDVDGTADFEQNAVEASLGTGTTVPRGTLDTVQLVFLRSLEPLGAATTPPSILYDDGGVTTFLSFVSAFPDEIIMFNPIDLGVSFANSRELKVLGSPGIFVEYLMVPE